MIYMFLILLFCFQTSRCEPCVALHHYILLLALGIRLDHPGKKHSEQNIIIIMIIIIIMAQSEKVGVGPKHENIRYFYSAHIPHTEASFRYDAAKQLGYLKT